MPLEYEAAAALALRGQIKVDAKESHRIRHVHRYIQWGKVYVYLEKICHYEYLGACIDGMIGRVYNCNCRKAIDMKNPVIVMTNPKAVDV